MDKWPQGVGTMNKLRTVIAGASAAALVLPFASPAQAQFGSLGDLVGSASRNSDQTDEAQTPEECEQDSSPSAGRRILGGLLGGAGRDIANDLGIPFYVPVEEFTDTLSTAIACRLDPVEQEQAANATAEATRGGDDGSGPEIGATAAWVSESREGVSGRSTVTGRDEPPGRGRGRGRGAGADCITVTDIIIVEGEETRDEKRMCRPAGGGRYAIVA